MHCKDFTPATKAGKVHDFPLICKLDTAAPQDTPDIEVVGCAASIQEALELVGRADVDVALVDIRL